MTPLLTDDEMPALPHPTIGMADPTNQGRWVHYYTAEQMRARDRAVEARVREKMGEGVVYGIFDPDYARIFTKARCLAWAEGYALAMHGSFTRDLDLLAVPWADHACDPEHLVGRIADACELKPNGHPPSEKPHGRRAWTLKFREFGDPRFIDLSVMPPSGAGEKR